MEKEGPPNIEPWERRLVKEAQDFQKREIKPWEINLTNVPLNGTIMTVKFQDSAGGGAGSDLIVKAVGNIYPGYSIHVLPSQSFLFPTEGTVGRMNLPRPGDFGRAIVLDSRINLQDTNYFTGTLLRKLVNIPPEDERFVKDLRDQILVRPADLDLMFRVALAPDYFSDKKWQELQYGEPNITHGTISNDFNSIRGLPPEVLKAEYRTIRERMGIPLE